jgi:serralysin
MRSSRHSGEVIMAGTKTIPLSGNGDIDALLQDHSTGSTFTPTIWNTGNLTISFPTSASFYNYAGTGSNEPGQNFQEITATGSLSSAVELALARYAAVANLTFTPITETTSVHADIRFAIADLPSAEIGYFPGDPAGKSGDVWFDSDTDWENLAFPGTTNSQFLVVMHEIGHALGLSHPGFSMDPSHVGWDYTIMSYQSYPNAPFNFSGGIPTSPMLDDVAAIQYMYGANFNTNAGDSVYSWSPVTGQMFINGHPDFTQVTGGPNGVIYMTLWDGGGNDTYDLSNYTTNVVADLRPGEFSSPSPNQVVTHSSPGDPLVKATGSIANAYLYEGDTRSLIENAIGGSGNDKLTGNQGNNVLTGNGGDDTFFYTGGVDTFFGGAKGAHGDTADFSLSEVGVVITPVATVITTPIFGGGSVSVTIGDTSSRADAEGDAYDASYVSEVGPLRIVSMHGIENITGSPFADVITGNLGDNTIKAGDGNDYVYYTGGFDALDGGNGIDTVDFSQFGSAVFATLSLFVGVPEAYTTDTSSVLTGSSLRAIADLAGFDNLVGTSFADSLIGNSGNNNINGGAGDDFLGYNGGLDVLNGGSGNDTAQFGTMTSAVFVDLAGGGFEAKGNGTADASTGKLVNLADLQSIENLSGTSFNDVLRGDAKDNVIDGGMGNDILGGRAGDNTLNGGAGNDTYEFTGSARDRYFDDSGTDKISIDSVDNIRSAGRSGNDLIIKFANGTIDIVDQFNGHPIETLVDSHGTSLVLATNMTGGDLGGIIGGTDGNDMIDGRGGDDYLFGGKGNDQLLGGTGDDHMDGGAGRDVLDGGKGNDRLTGGEGNDTFVFAPGSGHDVVTDFSPSSHPVIEELAGSLPQFLQPLFDFAKGDQIEFDGGVFHDFRDVLAASHQVGNDTVITMSANDSITLQGVNMHNLHASDFLFV